MPNAFLMVEVPSKRLDDADVPEQALKEGNKRCSSLASESSALFLFCHPRLRKDPASLTPGMMCSSTMKQIQCV